MLSRFHDEVWDFSNEDQNPATDKSAKRIRWGFEMPKGGRFTDPVFRHLLLASKQFIYALRWHPIDEVPLAASAIIQMFARTKRFIDHLLSYPIRFSGSKMYCPTIVKTIFKPFWAALSARATNTMCFTFSSDLFQYRGVMIDGLVMDPFRRAVGPQVRGLQSCTAVGNPNPGHSR